jgi:hypothetical protein
MGYLTSWSGPFTDDETKVNIGTTAIRYINKNNPTEIKTAIMKNGAVTGDYNSINDGNNSDRTAFFTTKNNLTIAGHSISVIGWDDNFSRENFDGRYTPKSDGAWLCKNSWAKYNSLGGYFWISYEDFYLFNDDIFATSYAIEDYQIIEENHSLYQNEEFGATYEFDYVEDTENVIYMSKFDFSQKGNVLDKVVFETESLRADYTVYYVPVKNNFPVSDKKKWYTLDTGKVDYRGYICCDFEDMIISQSQGVIAIEIDTSEINKGIDSSKSNYTKNTIGVAEWLRSSSTKEIIFTQQSQAGECYISYDGTTMDLYDFYVKTFGDRVSVINGYKPIVRMLEDEAVVYSCPWAGKEGWKSNTFASLGGICLIHRGRENRIRRITPSEYFDELMHQVYIPKNSEAMLKTLDLMDALAKTVPFYLLECDISEQAARTSFEAMIVNG